MMVFTASIRNHEHGDEIYATTNPHCKLKTIETTVIKADFGSRVLLSFAIFPFLPLLTFHTHHSVKELLSHA